MCALRRQSMISEPPLLVSSSEKQVRPGPARWTKRLAAASGDLRPTKPARGFPFVNKTRRADGVARASEVFSYRPTSRGLLDSRFTPFATNAHTKVTYKRVLNRAVGASADDQRTGYVHEVVNVHPPRRMSRCAFPICTPTRSKKNVFYAL